MGHCWEPASKTKWEEGGEHRGRTRTPQHTQSSFVHTSPHSHQLHTHLCKRSCFFHWLVITAHLLHARHMLRALHVFAHFTFTTAQRGECYDYSHFTDTEAESPVQACKLVSGGTWIWPGLANSRTYGWCPCPVRILVVLFDTALPELTIWRPEIWPLSPKQHF